MSTERMQRWPRWGMREGGRISGWVKDWKRGRSGDEAGVNGSEGETGGKEEASIRLPFPSGAKARTDSSALSARLKSCPDTRPGSSAGWPGFCSKLSFWVMRGRSSFCVGRVWGVWASLARCVWLWHAWRRGLLRQEWHGWRVLVWRSLGVAEYRWSLNRNPEHTNQVRRLLPFPQKEIGRAHV